METGVISRALHRVGGYYLRAVANISTEDYTAVCDDVNKAREYGSEPARDISNRYCHLSRVTAGRGN